MKCVKGVSITVVSVCNVLECLYTELAVETTLGV